MNRPFVAGLPGIMRPGETRCNEAPARRMEAAARMLVRLEVPSEPFSQEEPDRSLQFGYTAEQAVKVAPFTAGGVNTVRKSAGSDFFR